MAISNFVFGVICLSISFASKVQAATLTFKSSEPETIYLEYGKTLNLTVSYQYDGNREVAVTWSFNGDDIIRVTDDGSVLFNHDPLRAKIVGQASLQLVNTNFSDNGTFSVTGYALDATIDSLDFKVIIQDGPTFINFKSNVTNNIAQVGDYVKLTCLADGNPKPSYNITFVRIQAFEEILTSIEGILIIKNVNIIDDGTYRCVAKNNFGSKEAELFLNVTAKATQSTTAASTTVPTSSTNKTTANSSMTSPVPPTTAVFFSTEKAISDKNNGGTEWYIVVITLFCGIGIGIIFSFTVMWLYRRRKEKRDHPKPSQARRVSETHDNPSVYQELDLQRMNNEDSYQSLRKTSRPVNRQEPTVEAAESSYQELDKVRGSNDDNNYQSLNRV